MNKLWRLILTYQESHYLTDEEKDRYLSAVSQGLQYVQVGTTKYLSTKFISLVHEADIEETKRIDEGKWQCGSGAWHTKGVECGCRNQYVFDESSQTYKLITNKLN